jgi:hypothetical protein
MHAFTLFLKFDATPWRVSAVTGNGSPDEILSICLDKRIGKCIPKLILASYIRTRCQAVFDNEHSLHLWKRHPCISTVWRQLTDWREQVTTWRDLRRPLCSHSDVVCIYINPVELYWIATINKYFNMGCMTFHSVYIGLHICIYYLLW